MEKKSLRILWVSPRWLLPINDGARRATHQLLQMTTSEENISCDLVIWSERSTPPTAALELKKSYGLDNIFIHQRFLSFLPEAIRKMIFFILSILTRKPFSAFGFFSLRLHWLNFRGFLDQYDQIVFDAPHAAFSFIRPFTQSLYAQTGQVQKMKTILRAHNVETLLWHKQKKSTNSFITQVLMNCQIGFMKKYENFIAQKSHTIACVSFKDARRFQRLFKKVNAVEIPISFDFDRLNSFKQNSAEPSIIWGFIGKFDWPPNHDGLLWFLTYVWSRVQKQSHHRLVIAGSGTLSKELEKAIRDAQIQYLGFVNDINEFYSQIDAVIIPIFYGGGTRVKAIEAAQFGKIIVSTRLGVEGLSLIQDTDYLRAETLNQWTQIISETKIDKTLREKARNAHLKTSQKFSNKAVKKAWLNCLN